MDILKDVIQERAKRNISLGGGDRKSGSQELGKAIIEKVHTNKELGKIAGVSDETIRKYFHVCSIDNNSYNVKRSLYYGSGKK